MSERMTYGGHVRAVLKLGLPLIGGHLAQLAIGMTDTVMMGWYGVPELAALTLASSLFFTLFLFGSGFAWAIMPMVATFEARDETVQVRRATRMALWLSILYFALMLPLLWWSGPILQALGQTEELAGLAQTYLRIAGFGMLPALGVMVMKNYLAGLEHTRVVLWVTVAAAFGNVAMNYALVFGNWGAPELGIAGAALASVFVQVVSLILIVVYALRVLPEHALFQRFWRPDWEMFGQVFRLGWPIGLTTLAEVALFAGTSVLMGVLGEVPLAAHGIVIQVATATFMIQMGLSNAATVRVGNALGRRDVRHMLDGAKVVLALSAVGLAFSIALFVLAPEALIGLFIDPEDPQRGAILDIGRDLMLIAALFQLADAVQVVHLGLLRGLQDTRMPMWIAGFAYWAVGMPTAAGLGLWLGWGGIGVWLGLTFGLTVAAVALGWRFWQHGAGMVLAGAGADD